MSKKEYYNKWLLFCNYVITSGGDIKISEAKNYIPESQAIELMIKYAGKNNAFINNCVNLKGKIESILNTL